MPFLVLIFIGLILAILLYNILFFKFGYVHSDNYVCLLGKTALVTGGSSGIGNQIVLSLASRGCRVIIADKIVNETIKRSIVDETDNPNIVLEYVDFASFKSIRNFSEKLKRTEEKLDILINNVGIGKAFETPTEDGINRTMQINYYGPFLLTHLLIDLLKKSNGGRIVFTSSVASFLHNMSRELVTSDTIKVPHYRVYDYANAKFLTVVASDILAEKVKQFNITCNVYHPGIAKSNFFKNTKEHMDYYSFTELVVFTTIYLLTTFVGVDPRKAAQAGINLAISKKFKNTTGIFFGKYLPNVKPKLADDKIFCKTIWTASEKTVELKPDEKL